MPSVLIAEDDLDINMMLKTLLTSRGYEVFSAFDGCAALELFKEVRPHVVLLDIRMPGMEGMAVLREIKKMDPAAGVIMVTATYDDNTVKEAMRLGAHEFIAKPFKLAHIENSIMSKISDIITSSANKLQASYDRLQRTLSATIEAMGRVVETRDPYTAGHQQRVAALAEAIAEEMPLPEEQIKSIKLAALIHDLGKIYVPAEILSMPRKLTVKEFEIIKEHPVIGYEILKPIQFDSPIAECVLQHHERLDGSGYPYGLSKSEICIEAKIIAVADTVEAMSSFRPYRPAIGLPAALKEINLNRGILYASQVVDACIKVFRRDFIFPDKKT